MWEPAGCTLLLPSWVFSNLFLKSHLFRRLSLFLIFAMPTVFKKYFKCVPRWIYIEEMPSPTSIKILIKYAIVDVVTQPLVGLPGA